MKKIALFLPLLLMVTMVSAQVKNAAQTMSQGNNPALSIYLKNTTEKSIEDAWEKYIKKYKGKTKMVKKSGEIFSDNAEIDKISNNTVDVYAKVIANGEDTELNVWFDLGGAYLSSNAHPDGYAVATKMLEEFKLSVSKAAMDEEIKAQEALLKKMTGDLSSMEKNQSNLEGDIVKYEKKIEEAQQKIKESQAAQKDKAGEIATQQTMIKDLKGKRSSLK